MLDTISEKFHLYKVGGCVRDAIMGVEPKDVDYTVQASQESFEQFFPTLNKVGDCFPVYLNTDGSEIALTRSEKCVGEKYQDFEVHSGVQIEVDLGRRDFTINSIAQHYLSGEIVDPFNGAEDVKNKILRCVNPVAFVEDPLRIYRGARFISRFCLKCDVETMDLMKQNVEKLVNIPTDRVCAELKKVYEDSKYPSMFFKFLHEIDALKYHFKPLADLTNFYAGPEHTHHVNDTAFEHVMKSIDLCAEKGYSYQVFLAVLFHDVGKAVTAQSEDYRNGRHHYGHEHESAKILTPYLNFMRFTKHENKLINVVANNHMIHNLTKMKPVKLIRFFKRVKYYAWDFVRACDCDYPFDADQFSIINRLERTFKEADVNVPKHILKRGNDATINFVENVYAHKYKEILNEGKN